MTVRKSIAIAMLGALGAFGMMQPTIPTVDTQAYARPSRREINKYRAYGSLLNYPSHDGHSVAHGKRLAAKARNVKRHKRATKGRSK